MKSNIRPLLSLTGLFNCRSRCILAMGNAHLPPYLTLTSTATPGFVSAAVRVDYRPALSASTALAMPQWWSTTSKSLLTVPASGTKRAWNSLKETIRKWKGLMNEWAFGGGSLHRSIMDMHKNQPWFFFSFFFSTRSLLHQSWVIVFLQTAKNKKRFYQDFFRLFL